MLFYTSMYLVVYHVSMLFPRGMLAWENIYSFVQIGQLTRRE